MVFDSIKNPLRSIKSSALTAVHVAFSCGELDYRVRYRTIQEVELMKYASLVDGALGFTGRRLVEYCLSKGDNVVATDVSMRDTPCGWKDYESLGMLLCKESNLTDKSSLEELFRHSGSQGFRIGSAYRNAAVFDMSAHLDKLLDVNVNGSENFCEIASEHGVDKVLYVSTASIYGHTHKGQLIDEDVGFEFTGDYPATKYSGERIHFKYRNDLPCLIARPGLKYGPGSVYGAIILLDAVCKLGLVPTVGMGDEIGKAATTYLHIYNDIAAMRHLMKNGNFAIRAHNENDLAYNIADRNPRMGMTQEELMLLAHQTAFQGPVHEISRAVQKKVPKPRFLVEVFAKLNDFASRRYGFPALLEPSAIPYYFSDHIFDTDKLAATGFEWPVPSTHDGMKQTLEWYECNGWPGLPDLSPRGILNILKDCVKK